MPRKTIATVALCATTLGATIAAQENPISNTFPQGDPAREAGPTVSLATVFPDGTAVARLRAFLEIERFVRVSDADVVPSPSGDGPHSAERFLTGSGSDCRVILRIDWMQSGGEVFDLTGKTVRECR